MLKPALVLAVITLTSWSVLGFNAATECKTIGGVRACVGDSVLEYDWKTNTRETWVISSFSSSGSIWITNPNAPANADEKKKKAEVDHVNLSTPGLCGVRDGKDFCVGEEYPNPEGGIDKITALNVYMKGEQYFVVEATQKGLTRFYEFVGSDRIRFRKNQPLELRDLRIRITGSTSIEGSTLPTRTELEAFAGANKKKFFDKFPAQMECKDLAAGARQEIEVLDYEIDKSTCVAEYVPLKRSFGGLSPDRRNLFDYRGDYVSVKCNVDYTYTCNVEPYSEFRILKGVR